MDQKYTIAFSSSTNMVFFLVTLFRVRVFLSVAYLTVANLATNIAK